MSRLETTLGGIDIVSAITQATINDQFAGLKQLKVIPDDLELKLPKGVGTLKVKLLAPTVILGLEDKPRQILFILHFSSGSFSTFDEDSEPTLIPFGAGALALNVDVNLDNISGNKAPKSVQEAIKNLGPGMFSMRQLYLDFQNAILANYDPVHTKLPQTLLNDPYFMTGLTMLLKSMHDKGANILGYAVTVTNPNEVAPEAPTFPPTDINFATNIYVARATNKRTPELDTLNYLLMTQKRPFPQTLPSGNFVEGAADGTAANGTMAIARSVFTEGYLLPLLSKITNLSSTFAMVYDDGNADLQTVKGVPFLPDAPGRRFDELAGAGGKAGIIQELTDDYIKNGAWRVPNTNLGTTPSDYPSDPAVTCWTFHSTAMVKEEFRNCPIWGTHRVVAGIVCHVCELRIMPGSNEITLRGLSSIGLSYDDFAGVVGHAIHALHTGQSKLKWRASLRLVADSAGGITAQTEFSADPVQNQASGNQIGRWGMSHNPGLIVDMSRSLGQAITSGGLSEEISNAFSRQNTFVFPGGQQYFFKDLVFNNSLDLLATLTIKFY